MTELQTTASTDDAEAFVRANTRRRPVEFIPQISLHQADDAVGLWQRVGVHVGHDDPPLPFWAFAWAGGVALSAYVLEHPDLVAGRRVVDIATGSGLVAIAAARAGAAHVAAYDVDPLAAAAARLNAAANGVAIDVYCQDPLDATTLAADVVLVGDVYYDKALAARMTPFLHRFVDQRISVLIGDPDRPYLRNERLTPLAVYDVPETGHLENADTKRTTVWSLSRDWAGWHDGYADPDSVISRRLATVQGHIAAALDAHPAGPIQAISMCAGQGRDLLGALGIHPRRDDVRARLVELDPEIATHAHQRASEQALDGVEVVIGDAAATEMYSGAVPADLVLACGIFGNISDEDIERTVSTLPRLCARDATVIWTRHRREPDLVPTICDWFKAAGFSLEWLSERDEGFGVGVHRYLGEPLPLDSSVHMFTFRV